MPAIGRADDFHGGKNLTFVFDEEFKDEDGKYAFAYC